MAFQADSTFIHIQYIDTVIGSPHSQSHAGRGNTIVKQMVPIILINLLIGFLSTGIDNFAHIGGLVGGILSSMVVGLKYKKNKTTQINGIIISIIVLIFLIYVNFFVSI